MLCIRFVDKIRNEIKFDNLQALQQQLYLDREKAIEILQ